MAKLGPVISIDDEWYNLEKWADNHPGGAHILRQFHMKDATDVFYSLHSHKAINQLKKHFRPEERKETNPETRPIDASFRQFRAKLENDGWFKRDPLSEMALLLPILSMTVLGTYLSYSHPWTAIFLIGVAQQQAGWLGHDMTHARNSDYCDTALAFVSGFINGFNRDWWSSKHNTHHVLTNHIGEDPDIDLMPAIFIMPPNSAADNHMRKYQHFYFLPAYSLLFVSWRQQSMWRAIIDKDYKQIFTTLLPGYVWLLCMPWLVSIGAMLLSGLLVAIVVTQSHECEEFVAAGAGPGSYVLEQFQSTRDIDCPDPITEYLFGGMQYQLTHHLFPTLPRYKNAKLQKVVMQWAKENDLVYKHCGLVECLTDHVNMLKENATAACNEATGAKSTCPEPGWSLEIQQQWAK